MPILWFILLCIEATNTPTSCHTLFPGLVKAKKYDWKDSNLAMFGSDTEKEVKSRSPMPHFENQLLNVTLIFELKVKDN